MTGPVQIAMTPVDVTKPAAGGFPGRSEGVNANASVTQIMSWVNSRAFIGSTLVVQRNTEAGWSAFVTGAGQIPQLYEHCIITSSRWTPRPLAIGGELYLAIVERTPGGGSSAQRIRVLRYVP